MYYRHKSNIITIISIFAVVLLSCTNGGNDDFTSTDDDVDVIMPTSLTFTINIIGSDTNNPNGDGSGAIQISASATNAISYSFRPGTGAEYNNTSGVFEFTYTEGGINDYTVQVLAYSSTEHSVIASEVISVFVSNNSTLTWSDEFNGDGLVSSSNWFSETVPPNSGSWWNEEQQHYTDRLDNSYMSNGTLKIVAKKENYTAYGSTKAYTSARLNSLFSFTYGRVDVKAKLPIGDGTWPAIWMLGSNRETVGWPACGEIDIMEHNGNNQGTVSSAIHTPSSYGNTVNKGTRYISNVSTEFHVYSVNWTPEKIEFLIDDIIHYTYNPAIKDSNTWPFDADQFIILNVAMGGTFVGTIDPNFTESTMEIDYIRVYQ